MSGRLGRETSGRIQRPVSARAQRATGDTPCCCPPSCCPASWEVTIAGWVSCGTTCVDEGGLSYKYKSGTLNGTYSIDIAEGGIFPCTGFLVISFKADEYTGTGCTGTPTEVDIEATIVLRVSGTEIDILRIQRQLGSNHWVGIAGNCLPVDGTREVDPSTYSDCGDYITGDFSGVTLTIERTA